MTDEPGGERQLEMVRSYQRPPGLFASARSRAGSPRWVRSRGASAKTGGQELFRADDNLESVFTRPALRQLYLPLYSGKIEDCSLQAFEVRPGSTSPAERHSHLPLRPRFKLPRRGHFFADRSAKKRRFRLNSKLGGSEAADLADENGGFGSR
jgi:hypothetical protein